MLPPSYELPAAILLVLGGALSCFAGYRLFRIVLGDLRLHPRRDAGQLDDGRQQHRPA